MKDIHGLEIWRLFDEEEKEMEEEKELMRGNRSSSTKSSHETGIEEIEEKNNDGRGYRGEEQITKLFQNFHQSVRTLTRLPCRHIFRTRKTGQKSDPVTWTHADKEKIYSIHTRFRQRPSHSYRMSILSFPNGPFDRALQRRL